MMPEYPINMDVCGFSKGQQGMMKKVQPGLFTVQVRSCCQSTQRLFHLHLFCTAEV